MAAPAEVKRGVPAQIKGEKPLVVFGREIPVFGRRRQILEVLSSPMVRTAVSQTDLINNIYSDELAIGFDSGGINFYTAREYLNKEMTGLRRTMKGKDVAIAIRDERSDEERRKGVEPRYYLRDMLAVDRHNENGHAVHAVHVSETEELVVTPHQSSGDIYASTDSARVSQVAEPVKAPVVSADANARFFDFVQEAALQVFEVRSPEWRRRKLKPHEVGFRKGDSAESLVLLGEGRVALESENEDGRVYRHRIVDAPRILGTEVIEGGPRIHTLRAELPSELYHIPKDVVGKLINENPNFSTALLLILADEIRFSRETLEDAYFLDAPGRLAKSLLSLGAELMDKDEKGRQFVRGTQPEIADYVGVTRESVNKYLAAFKSRGIIEIKHTPRGVVIIKPDDLRRRIY